LRFWDSSTIVPLLFEEPTSGTLRKLLREDTEVAAWWGTWVESAVAVSRLKREGRLDDDGEDEARAVLDLLADEWREVEATDELRILAAILSKRYPLKAADVLQLAAALQWRDGGTQDQSFVCLDDRLRSAASAEGFRILPERSAVEIEAEGF
jgi:predicted nucleic acid-binding protein